MTLRPRTRISPIAPGSHAAPDSGSTMRTSTPSKGCPQLPCLPSGRSRSSRAPQYGPNVSVMPNRFARAPGAGRMRRRQHRGEAAGPEARQVGGRELRVRTRGARPGRASPGTASPVPVRGDRGCVSGSGIASVSSVAPATSDAQAVRRRGRRSRRTASGCRAGRRGRCNGRRGSTRPRAARRRGCGRRPWARRGSRR